MCSYMDTTLLNNFRESYFALANSSPFAPYWFRNCGLVTILCIFNAKPFAVRSAIISPFLLSSKKSCVPPTPNAIIGNRINIASTLTNPKDSGKSEGNTTIDDFDKMQGSFSFGTNPEIKTTVSSRFDSTRFFFSLF